MAHSSQGIVRDEMGQEQPADKRRAQTRPPNGLQGFGLKRSHPRPKLADGNKTPRIRRLAG
jgi:hypothetical protein